MAKGLFLLGHYFYNKEYAAKAEQMLKNVVDEIPGYAPGYSNWGILMLNMVNTFYEVAITGEKANELKVDFSKNYIPNKLLVGSTKESTLPLLDSKFTKDQTRIFICIDKACKAPTTEVEKALKQIDEL